MGALILHSQTPLQANLANIGKIDGIDRKKKSLHARTKEKLLCQFCAISLQKQAIFWEMWQ